MVYMGVYAAIAHKTQQVQGLVIGFCIAYRLKEDRVLCKAAIPDGDIDPFQFLVNDAACSQIEMTYFAIAHLPFRQSHCLATGN